MSDVLSNVRFPPEKPLFERYPSVRPFLAESQRRVIDHCRRLLKAQDLATEHRERLIRLVELAEAELQRPHSDNTYDIATALTGLGVRLVGRLEHFRCPAGSAKNFEEALLAR